MMEDFKEIFVHQYLSIIINGCLHDLWKNEHHIVSPYRICISGIGIISSMLFTSLCKHDIFLIKVKKMKQKSIFLNASGKESKHHF